MTSGEAINSSSSLNGKVTEKGNVRIWAGEMQTPGDLTSAATTISSDGVITAQNITKGKYVEIDPNNCTLKMVGPSNIRDDSDGLPGSSDRTDLVDFSYDYDADGLTSYPTLTLRNGGGSPYISICPNTENFGIKVKGLTDSQESTTITDGVILLGDKNSRKISLDTASGALYDSIANFKYSDSVYVDISCKYNGGVMANKLLFVLKGLPTSDPGVSGALYTDNSGNLKVSL